MAHSEETLKQIIAECTEALQITPNDFKALLRRGAAWHKRECYIEAITDLDRAVILEPADARVHSLRGLALASTAEHDVAIDDFTTAIRLRAADESLLASCYSDRGRCKHLKRANDEGLPHHEA